MVNGRYKVTFTLPGFNTAAREVEVRAGDRLRLDLGLAVGGLTEEVSVVAETPLLETTTATRSQVVAQELVENLPSSGRNPFTLSHVVPGVVGEAGNRQSIQLRPFDNGGMDGISINGGVARSNSFTLDGAPNTSREGGTSGSLAFVPSPDAVEEVRVATSTYDAQFGRTGGGTIAVSIRSGTNQFHGTAYYIHRDAALNANLYENIVRGIPKQEIFHYNPGATIGGPIKRDRTFFFYSYEGLKSGIPVGAGQRTPTELERNGDFSQSGFTIYDPLNTRQRSAAALRRQHHSPRPHGSGRAQHVEVHAGGQLAARCGRQQLFPGRELALRYLHVGDPAGRSQPERKPPPLRALRAQRTPRDPRLCGPRA